jgi:hypothetical protein
MDIALKRCLALLSLVTLTACGTLTIRTPDETGQMPSIEQAPVTVEAPARPTNLRSFGRSIEDALMEPTLTGSQAYTFSMMRCAALNTAMAKKSAGTKYEAPLRARAVSFLDNYVSAVEAQGYSMMHATKMARAAIEPAVRTYSDMILEDSYEFDRNGIIVHDMRHCASISSPV